MLHDDIRDTFAKIMTDVGFCRNRAQNSDIGRRVSRLQNHVHSD